MMPRKLTNDFEKWFAAEYGSLNVNGITLAEKAWNACYNELMQNAKVVDQSQGCDRCSFRHNSEVCNFIRDKSPCDTKRAIILIEE